MRVASVFLSQRHGISHVRGASIVGCQYEAEPLRAGGDIAERDLEFCQIARGSGDVLRGFVDG